MRVSATDNLGKAFANQKVVVGELKVPVIGLKMGVPIVFDARYGEVDAVDRAELEAKAAAMIAQVTDELAGAVEAALNKALKSSVWAWRGGSRDIFDTGELARSGRVTADADGISVTYSAPYANLVHNGGYIYPYGNQKLRPVYLPARPWVSSVLYGGGPVEQFDFDKFLSDRLG